MLKHRWTRGEVLLVLAASVMIGAVAASAGRRQSAEQTATPAAVAPASTAVVAAEGDKVRPAGHALAASESACADCPLVRDAALADVGGATGSAAAGAAGKCDSGLCQSAVPAVGAPAGSECSHSLTGGRGEPTKSVEVGAKPGHKTEVGQASQQGTATD